MISDIGINFYPISDIRHPKIHKSAQWLRKQVSWVRILLMWKVFFGYRISEWTQSRYPNPSDIGMTVFQSDIFSSDIGITVHWQNVEVTNAEWTKRQMTKRRKTKRRMGQNIEWKKRWMGQKVEWKKRRMGQKAEWYKTLNGKNVEWKKRRMVQNVEWKNTECDKTSNEKTSNGTKCQKNG